jgi:hypothetical protein
MLVAHKNIQANCVFNYYVYFLLPHVASTEIVYLYRTPSINKLLDKFVEKIDSAWSYFVLWKHSSKNLMLLRLKSSNSKTFVTLS